MGRPAEASGPARRTWNRTPVGSQRSSATVGTAKYFVDLCAYRYGYETPFIPEFFDFGRMHGKSVLEVGVGNGTDAVEMARAGARYTGIDITERHLALTRLNFQLNGLEDPTLLEGDLLQRTDLGPFDVVYSFGVLHHIPDEQRYLERIRALLSPGGALLIGVYSKFSSFNAYLATTWLLRAPRGTRFDDWRSHVAELSALGDPVTIRIRSRRQVVRLLTRAGFEVLRYRKHGFTQGHLPWFGRHCNPSGPVLAWLGARLGWYHLFECRVAGRT